MSDSARANVQGPGELRPSPEDGTGVFVRTKSDGLVMVHRYELGDYGLEDVWESFRLGEVAARTDDGPMVLHISGSELAELKRQAYAASFDHEETFIEMCLDMGRWGEQHPQERYTFLANF